MDTFKVCKEVSQGILALYLKVVRFDDSSQEKIRVVVLVFKELPPLRVKKLLIVHHMLGRKGNKNKSNLHPIANLTIKKMPSSKFTR